MKAFLISIKSFIKRCDLFLLSIALLNSGIGLVAINSATQSLVSGRNKYLIVQGGAIILGIGVFLFISLIDIERFANLWPLAYLFNLALLFSLYFFGIGGDTTGNNGWIRFAGIGIQPAEIGKIIFIFTFARHIYVLRDRFDRPSSLLLLIGHALSTAGFVYIFSDDLGMCIVYLFIFVIMLFASGLPMKLFLPLCGTGLAALVPVWKFVLKGYQKDRILVLFDPTHNPKIAWNGIQSMIATGGGMLFGHGYMNGPQTQYSLLPAKHTDFLFASYCEEWGFIGGIVVLVLLAALVWRIYYAASECSDRFSYLICIGIGGMFMCQILINVGMCLGVMPVIGITLPFFSYGGTSVVTNFVAIGIVSSLRMRTRPDRLR